MRAVLDFLFREQVEHSFTEDELTSLSHLEAKDLELVRQTYSNLGSDPGWMERFLDWWLSNHGLRHDLQWFAQRREPLTTEEKHQVLYLGRILERPVFREFGGAFCIHQTHSVRCTDLRHRPQEETVSPHGFGAF